jgi:hypothetical protein
MAGQTRNRSQVSTARLDINATQQTPDTIGSTGECGVRNGRGMSGRVRRSTGTAIDTTRKANSVPMLTISASVLSGTSAAMTATPATVSDVISTGVPNRGWTRLNTGGSSPSRARANPIRPIATMSTRITELSPATAASPIRTPAQPRPTWRKTCATASPSRRSV